MTGGSVQILQCNGSNLYDRIEIATLELKFGICKKSLLVDAGGLTSALTYLRNQSPLGCSTNKMLLPSESWMVR
jgi:hypothetical protein